MNVQSVVVVVCAMFVAQGNMQGTPQSAATPASASARVTAGDPSGDYVIGPDDVLSIKFWKDPDASAEVTVRPDGKITLPLGKEIAAAGLTPDQLLEAVLEQARRFMESPSATITVKQINSRKVFITGMVAKPGSYPISSPTTVMQLISLAGGLMEFAKAKEIVIIRSEARGPTAYPFNYEEVSKGKRLAQNIVLRPGDNVVVPE
jgi:polysaccharide export outer membrane protein